MQKKYLLIPLIALTLFIPRAMASSPTPSPSPASDQEVTENLKKMIIENLDKAKETSSPTPSIAARAYIGIVKDVIKDTIIMQDKDGEKDIKLQDDTNIIRSPGNTVIKAENIRIDDYIIAIGYPGESETLTARRLIVSIDPIQPAPKTSGIGIIEKIGKTTISLKLSDKDQILTITPKTVYKSSVGSIELVDLSVGDTLIYTATVGEKDVLTATVVMRTQTASIAE
jgi:hypothetical protein